MMSCNGCRVLRKGCSDTCILRPCIQWIESSDAQGHATVFVAKFFGRAGLMGFISAVPETQRPALFQSLLYEACGRTVNPVFGAVGLLWSGNWQACQAAVDTVLKGGSLRPTSPTSLSSSCLPTNLSSDGRPFPASEKFSTPLNDGTQGAHAPASISLTESISDRQKIALGIGSSSARSLQIDNGAHPDTKEWHQPRDTGFLDLHGTPVVCPSPRRVRARVGFFAGPRPQEYQGADQLELDLTLKVKGEKVGSKRVSSASESVNSEGSVTSLDSTPYDPARTMPTRAGKTSLMAPPFRQLLPLLQ